MLQRTVTDGPEVSTLGQQDGVRDKISCSLGGSVSHVGTASVRRTDYYSAPSRAAAGAAGAGGSSRSWSSAPKRTSGSERSISPTSISRRSR
jgi:hypothetical protein